MDENSPKSKYCTRIPVYPNRAFMVYFTLSDSDMKFHYPASQIFTTLAEVSNEAKLLMEIISMRNNLELNSVASILPITLDKLFPLKEQYWHNPNLHYDYFQRMDLFLRMLDMHEFYKLLVTPLHDKNKEIFVSAAPFYITATEADIEKFMLLSDFPVDETAKFAAIYKIGAVQQLNWQTGHFI